MHLILTGATGRVGSGILSDMLSQMPDPISRLTILSRRPVPMAEGKDGVTVVQHKDFNEYSPELLDQLRGAQGCVWALGISQYQASKEDFIKITKDYPLAAAKAFSGLSESFNFVYISGNGTTMKPGMFTPFYGVIKGQCEKALLDLIPTTPSLKPYSMRLGWVDPFNQPEVQNAISGREVPFGQRVFEPVVGPVMRKLMPNSVSPTEETGHVASMLAMGNGQSLKGDDILDEGRIVTSNAVRRLAKEKVVS